MDYKWMFHEVVCVRALGLACLLIIIAGGCQTQAEPTSSNSSESFQLVLSKGGGFSGLTQGYTLHGNGRIERWRQAPLGDRTKTGSHVIDPSQVAAFKQQLEAAGILGKTLQETGNMTTRVGLETDQDKQAWSWATGGDTATVPVALKEWFQLVWTFCSQLFATP